MNIRLIISSLSFDLKCDKLEVNLGRIDTFVVFSLTSKGLFYISFWFCFSFSCRFTHFLLEVFINVLISSIVKVFPCFDNYWYLEIVNGFCIFIWQLVSCSNLFSVNNFQLILLGFLYIIICLQKNFPPIIILLICFSFLLFLLRGPSRMLKESFIPRDKK